MRKLMVLLTLLCAMAWAQDTAKKDKNTENGGLKSKTVTGCIHKEGDNIWLTTRTSKYHLMAKEDLSAHDGHEVKATGNLSKGPVPNADPKKDVNHLDVTNVEMVSDHCKMGTKKAPKEPKKAS
jgi:hypothetical protein